MSTSNHVQGPTWYNVYLDYNVCHVDGEMHNREDPVPTWQNMYLEYNFCHVEAMLLSYAKSCKILGKLEACHRGCPSLRLASPAVAKTNFFHKLSQGQN